jgi:polysaccharide export outer membrane protein
MADASDYSREASCHWLKTAGKEMMRRSVGLLVFAQIFVLPSLYAQAGMAKPVLKATPAPAQPADQATGSAAAASLPPDVSANYVIGAADNIQVTVWKEPNLSGPLTVRPDGKITLPLVGDVQADGLTPMKLAEDLSVRLKKYITDPLVTVTLVAVNSKRVFLLGEIGRVGPLALSPNMTILQAIATSGGLTPYANSKKIYILRGEVGSQKKIFFDYKKALKTGNEQGIVLQPGDTIVVP